MAITVASDLSEAEQVEHVLKFIGFSDKHQRKALQENYLEGLSDLRRSSEEDVENAAHRFLKFKNTNLPEGVYINPKQLSRLKAMMHWAQDFYRIGKSPMVVSALTKDEFIKALETAEIRAKARKIFVKQRSTALEAAKNHDKLTPKVDFHDWLEGLENLLEATAGVDGVPLSYLIRTAEQVKELEEADKEAGDTATWKDQMIRYAPHKSSDAAEDNETLFSILSSLLVGTEAAAWITKRMKVRKDGISLMTALRNHFQGQGVVDIRTKTAKAIYENLHYKNERVMSFETFATKLKEQLKVLKGTDRDVKESIVISDLWKKIQDPELATHVGALKVSYKRDPTGLDLTAILDSIASEIGAEKPSGVAGNKRNISVMYTREGTVPMSGIKMADGSIFIGNYPASHWSKLDNDQKAIVREQRPDQDGGRNRGKGKQGDKRKHDGGGGPGGPLSKRALKKLKTDIGNSVAQGLQTKIDEGFKAMLAELQTSDRHIAAVETEKEEKNLSKAGLMFGGRSEIARNKNK
jgi:hypothetical protein